MQTRQRAEIDLSNIDAVIFDMDGVITDTARTHAMAWKQLFDEYLQERSHRSGEPFQPFDAEEDYRKYVDGKPRFDGVKSFLESRGVSLPPGNPDDLEQETIYGLGNRKNEYFLERVRKNGVAAFSTTVRFIEILKSRGVRTAVISSSRNAEDILAGAGVRNLFDVKVDGIDSARLGLKGKPAPDIFLEAASRLGVAPNRAAIVEDALAGVEAGRRGGFRLVIGVSRLGQDEELLQHGADVVVRDIGELKIRPEPPIPPSGKEITLRRRNELPSARTKKRKLLHILRTGTPVAFMDFDGTLVPTTEDPDQIVVPAATRQAVRHLNEHMNVIIITGHDVEQVRDLLGIKGLTFAGNHGFDISGPGGRFRDQERGLPFLPVLAQVEAELRQALSRTPDALIEHRRFGIAVHYRQTEPSIIKEIEHQVDSVVGQHPELRKLAGRKVFEVIPNIDWNKGRTVAHLIRMLYVNESTVVPLYIGDALADEPAFREVRKHGVAVVVGVDQSETAAEYVLRDPAEVTVFLGELVDLMEKETERGVWTLVYEGFDPAQEMLRETLCTCGNGYFATRGAAPESTADSIHYPGTYRAGLYNRLDTAIAGTVIESESLVNLPNWLCFNFRLEGGDWFDARKVELLEYRQELDIYRGVLIRFIRFCDEKGRKTRINERRFASMADSHLAGLETTITAENWSGSVTIRAVLDGRVANTGVPRYLDLNSKHLLPVEEVEVDKETIYLQVETSHSHIRIAEAARTRVFQEDRLLEVERSVIRETGYIGQEFTVHVEEGNDTTIEKIVTLYTSLDRAISESGLEAKRWISRAASFDDLLIAHTTSWEHLWRSSRIAISDSVRTSLVLNLHIFHLLQTASLNTVDLDAGIPPRGLHGEAYRGHILWDELFIFPFLNLRIPEITRALLLYRYRRLPEARWMAREAGYRGAMYPWQSGSDGREESQTLHLNPRSGHWLPDSSYLQRHVNIAIAYNVWQYFQATGDMRFLATYGAEMLLEIARFWTSMARYNRSLDRYELKGIMGPDEYHEAYPGVAKPGLNNNAYTNIMAVWVLCRALELLDVLPDNSRDAIWDKLDMRRGELDRWDAISRKMRVVFHDSGIISQFEGYDRLEEFDWERYRQKYGDIQRLDRILEAEGDTPNRYKLSKQADVLMLFYLLSTDELSELFHRLGYPFDRETITRNIEYYMKRTAHGSTLSRLVHSWVLARSQRDLSWHLFKEALESDISDTQGGTAREGIHLGAMAGTVDLIQRCYTGIETRSGILWLDPYLPDDLKEMRFSIQYQRHWLDIRLIRDRIFISARYHAAAPIRIGFNKEIHELKPGETLELALLQPEPVAT